MEIEQNEQVDNAAVIENICIAISEAKVDNHVVKEYICTTVAEPSNSSQHFPVVNFSRAANLMNISRATNFTTFLCLTVKCIGTEYSWCSDIEDQGAVIAVHYRDLGND